MSVFAQRHYEAIAAVLQAVTANVKSDGDGWTDQDAYTYWSEGAYSVLGDVQERLLRLFEEDNPRFDAVRFVQAGVGDALLTGRDDIDNVLAPRVMDPETLAAVNAEGHALKRRSKFTVIDGG